MPIKIDDQLPARHNLELENIFVMTEQRASIQDIRPLKIILLNLMPTKIETETQILRELQLKKSNIALAIMLSPNNSPHFENGVFVVMIVQCFS